MAKQVDSRVIEMQFDNKNFEKNVSTSLSTLEKLKKALKMDDASKGLEKVDAAANKLNFDKLISAATALERRFSVFGEIGAAAIHRVTNSMIDLSTKTIGFLSNGIVQGGLKRAMNLEQADFQLQGLLKDTEAVAAIMENVSWSVDGTAYGLDAAAKAASMFAATGMRAGEEMKGALRGVAGVAAMTNSEYEDIARIFTTVAGQGRVMADQYNQLASRGLNAAAVLADYLTKVGDGAKVTEAQVREMTSNGEISFATFAAAMDDAFGEHAKAANKTFNGAMSNIRAALARIGADFISPIIVQEGPLVNMLNRIREQVNMIRKSTSPFAKEMTTTINELLTRTAEWISLLDFSYNSTPIRIVQTNWQSLVNIFTALKQVLTAVSAGFKDVFPESAGATLLDISQKVEGLTRKLIPSVRTFGNIRSAAQGFFTILRDGIEVVSMLGGGAMKLLNNALDHFDINISDIPGSVGKAIVAFKDWTDGVNIFLVPFIALGTALTTVKDKFSSWFNEFKKIPEVQIALEKLTNTLSPLVSGIKGLGGDAKKSIDDFIASVKTIDGVSFESLQTLFENLKKIVSGGVGGVWENLKNFPEILGNLKDAIGEQLNNIGTLFDYFWEGLKKGVKSIADFLTDGRTVAGILSMLFGFGLIKVVKDIKTNVLPLFATLPRLVDSGINLLNQLSKSIKQTTRANNFKKIAEGVYTIAKALTMLAAALVVLSQIDPEQLQNGGIALTMLAGGMAALVAAFAKLDSGGKVDIKGITSTMIGMAVSVLLLTKSIKDIAAMEDGVGKGLAVIGALMLGMTLVARTISKNQGVLDKGQKQMSSSVSMISFAFSIRTLVGVIENISKMPLGDIMGGLLVLTILMGEMVAMTKLTARGGWQSGVGMLALAASVHVLIGALEKIGDMDMAKLFKAELVMIAITGILALMSKALGGGGNNSAKSGVGLLAAAGSMLIIGIAIEKIGKLDVGTILKGLAVVTALGLVFAGIIASTKFAGDNAAKVGVTLLAMSASIAILAGVITLLGSLDKETVIQGTAAVSALMAMFAIVIASTKLANDCKATLIIMTVAITMLAAAIGILASPLFDPDAVTNASKALSLVMAMFSLMVASTGIAKKASSSVAVMALVVAELAAILAGLTLFDTEKMLPAAESLSLLMLALTASFVIISNAGNDCISAVAALAAMGIVLVEVAAVLGVLAALNIEPSLETSASLSLLLVAMAGVLALLSLMHVDVVTATNAALALSAFIGILGGVMVAIGALMEYVPGLENFLDKGIEILIKIGEGLGRFAGAIIEGFLDQIIGGLPGMADNLSLFMQKLDPFIAGAQSIDSKVVDGVTHLAGAIIAISAAQVIQGITNLLPFTGSMEDFGETLNALGKAMVEYSSTVAGKIDADSVVASATAAKALAELQNNLPRSGGALQDFLGEKMNLDTFGQKLEKFGYCLVRYSKAITSEGGIDANAIDASAKAAQALAELQNSLPSTGGVLQEWFGETMNLDDFGQKMEKFGYCLVRYSEAITSGKGLDGKAITDSAKAGQMLADLQNSLPTVGGKLQEWFGGTMDLATFGTQIILFGGALVGYCASLGVGGGLNTKLIEESAKAAKKLVELQNALPKESGWFQDFFGGGAMDMSEWGEKLKAFGMALSNYSAILAIGNGVNLNLIQQSVDGAKILMGLAESIPKDDGWGQGALVTFGNKIKEFGYAFIDGAKNIISVNPGLLAIALVNVQKLVDLTRSMKYVDTDAVANFGKSLKTLAANGIQEFIDEFSAHDTDISLAMMHLMTQVETVVKMEKSHVGEQFEDMFNLIRKIFVDNERLFQNGGQFLMNDLIKGFDIRKDNVNDKIKEILDYVLKTINNPYYKNFRTAGNSLMSQVIFGFSEKKNAVLDKLKEILNAGIKTINDKRGEYKSAADGVMTSFILAIDNAQPKAEESSKKVVKSLLDVVNAKQKDFKDAGSGSMNSLASGIDANAPKVTNSASNAVNKAYNEIYAYGNKGNKFYNVGAHYASGMALGIDEFAYKALSSAKYLAEKMDQAVRQTLKIKSPSKVAYETGGYYGEGFINSILDMVSRAVNAGKSLALGLDRGLADALDSTVSDISDHLNLSPVITPQIDASKALATASQINSLFNGGKAFRISSEIRDSRAPENQNGNSDTTSKTPAGNNYQFVQNNYSPKALSRIDIYRQTKNQFSSFKEVTVKR